VKSLNKLNYCHGLTLIELLITLSLTGLIIASVYSFYLTGLKKWQSSIAILDYQQSARIAMEKVVHELRYAHGIEIRASACEIRFKRDGDNRNLRFIHRGQEIVFESYPPGSHNYFHNKIALNIKELCFYQTAEGVITVEISTGDGSYSYSLKSAVIPLNFN